jgi:hypothetical protein
LKRYLKKKEKNGEEPISSKFEIKIESNLKKGDSELARFIESER